MGLSVHPNREVTSKLEGKKEEKEKEVDIISLKQCDV